MIIGCDNLRCRGPSDGYSLTRSVIGMFLEARSSTTIVNTRKNAIKAMKTPTMIDTTPVLRRCHRASVWSIRSIASTILSSLVRGRGGSTRMPVGCASGGVGGEAGGTARGNGATSGSTWIEPGGRAEGFMGSNVPRRAPVVTAFFPLQCPRGSTPQADHQALVHSGDDRHHRGVHRQCDLAFNLSDCRRAVARAGGGRG